jgi:hypothetical protein
VNCEQQQVRQPALPAVRQLLYMCHLLHWTLPILLACAIRACSRAPLAKEQLIPNTALLHKIEEWLQQHSHS